MTGIVELAIYVGIQKVVESGIQKVLVNQAHIDSQLQDLKNSIESLDSKIDGISAKISDQTIEKVHAAKQSLINAINSSKLSVRREQLSQASSKFNELIALDPKQTTNGTSVQFDNKYLITFGHIGNFYYFSLEKDYTNAAIQVYECVKKWIQWGNPLIALKMFPADFFSKNYCELFEDSAQSILDANQSLEKQLKKERLSILGRNVLYGTKKGLQAVGVVGITAAGLGVAAATRSGSGAYLAGEAVTKLSEIKISPPRFENIESIKEMIYRLEKRQKSLYSELTQECTIRQKTLQKTSFPLILSLERFLDKVNGEIPVDERDKLKRQVEKLQATGSLQDDVQAMKQVFKETSEILDSLSSLLEKTTGLVEDFEETRKTLESFGEMLGMSVTLYK